MSFPSFSLSYTHTYTHTHPFCSSSRPGLTYLGLSLLFFVLSLMGNVTYGASILFHSLERDYIITNLPWLIGSLGTIVEDGIIFVQFRVYAQEESRTTAVD